MSNSNQEKEPKRNRPLMMKIHPLWLREKFFWKFFVNKSSFFPWLFSQAKLEFSPQVSLNLMKSDISHQEIAFCGFYELPVSRRIIQLARSGGLMIDVGANYGYYSCLWASANAANRVIAFEASPRNLLPLKANLNQNRLENKLEVHGVAIGKKKGNLSFTLGPDESSGWGGLVLEDQANEANVIEVPVTSLDYFWHNRVQRIDVLKIDTEGADTWVLQGAEKLLQSHQIIHIFFEENMERMNALGIESGEAQNLLRDCGYQLKNLGRNEWYATWTGI